MSLLLRITVFASLILLVSEAYAGRGLSYRWNTPPMRVARGSITFATSRLTLPVTPMLSEARNLRVCSIRTPSLPQDRRNPASHPWTCLSRNLTRWAADCGQQ